MDNNELGNQSELRNKWIAFNIIKHSLQFQYSAEGFVIKRDGKETDYSLEIIKERYWLQKDMLQLKLIESDELLSIVASIVHN